MTTRRQIDESRARLVKPGPERSGPVAYWMSRDQRAHDNWALLVARALAAERGVPLLVAFCLVPSFLDAARRQYAFMLGGLQETAATLERKGIPMFLLTGAPATALPRFVADSGTACLVTDFDPLRIKQEWKKDVFRTIDIPVHEVDAHNVVPCWVVSDKQEYAARTIRPKLQRLLGRYLTPFPALRAQDVAWNGKTAPFDLARAREGVQASGAVAPVDWLLPGHRAARKTLRAFINERLARYPDQSNDPAADVQSQLSPYLHFGQLSAQRAALEVADSDGPAQAKRDFLEQLIVRRELSDNFCLHNPHYDSPAGYPGWALKTLEQHAADPRPHIYSAEELENAETHDGLWNVAQREMVVRGKMHGYMRMYWAKKILEWTPDVQAASEIAIRLNDRYELDGRDPNGYVGVAWSVGGVHDRAWSEREVFGKIRYMSRNGCRSKFDVRAYVERCGRLA